MGDSSLIGSFTQAEPHLVGIELFPHPDLAGENVTHMFAHADQLANHQPHVLIIDTRQTDYPSPTKETFAAASNLSSWPGLKAMSFIVTSSGVRLFINFFVRVYKPPVPVKGFANEKDACQWAREQVLLRGGETSFRTGITVSGKVQGVFFRKYCTAEAQRLSLTGFVRNENDGSVYIEATGAGNAILELLNWCKTGSPKATVSGVAFTFLQDVPDSVEFTIA